jgi:hypothetical protein
LEPKIGRNVKAHIDEIVVKSKKQGDLLDDLKEIFNNLCRYKMMLDPKSVFSVCHQRNYLAIWSHPGELMRTQKGGSHRTIATTSDPKGIPEAGRHDGSTQLIHIQVGRMWYAILQATMQSRWIPVG